MDNLTERSSDQYRSLRAEALASGVSTLAIKELEHYIGCNYDALKNLKERVESMPPIIPVS